MVFRLICFLAGLLASSAGSDFASQPVSLLLLFWPDKKSKPTQAGIFSSLNLFAFSFWFELLVKY